MKSAAATPTKYLRLLSYDNACRVIDFINKNDKEDYANITTGGVTMQVSDKNWADVESFIKSLAVRYEVGLIPPHEVTKIIVSGLKNTGKIKTNQQK